MISENSKRHLDEIEAKAAFASRQASKGLVLIIDDDTEFLRVASNMLKQRGERVFYTDNVFRFFEFIGRNNLKCVIVDWRFSGDNEHDEKKCGGEMIMKELHGRPIKQIIISRHDKDELLNTNGVPCIKKPPRNKNLLPFIDKLLLEINE